MREIIATARCYECGKAMEGKKGEYKYVESGLNSVFLKDILVFRCTNCSAVVPEIPAAGKLHWVIARRLLSKKTLLAGSELRFLRKLCGYSVDEFSEIMGSTRDVVYRWESKNAHGKGAHGKGTDRTVRLLVFNNFLAKLLSNDQPKLMPKNVTAEQLQAEVQKALKEIVRKHVSERYDIFPEEFAGLDHGPEGELAAVH